MPYFPVDDFTRINTDAPMSVTVAGATVTWQSPTSPSANISVTYADNAEAIEVRDAFVLFANAHPLYEQVLGGGGSLEEVKGAMEHLESRGFTEQEAIRAAVTSKMAALATIAVEEIVDA